MISEPLPERGYITRLGLVPYSQALPSEQCIYPPNAYGSSSLNLTCDTITLISLMFYFLLPRDDRKDDKESNEFDWGSIYQRKKKGRKKDKYQDE